MRTAHPGGGGTGILAAADTIRAEEERVTGWTWSAGFSVAGLLDLKRSGLD